MEQPLSIHGAGDPPRAGPLVSPEPGPTAGAPAPRWRRHAHLLVLLGLTLLGGAVRFYALDRPALWGDEALTYSRVGGSFQNLLDVLQNDGFTPLHYELYWLLNQWGPLGPAGMRAVPAAAGTIMIPAVYFLARRLVVRRTSLVAAGFAASSSYLVYYSRDAKMYAELWLFATLHVACLFWWLGGRRRVAWLAWVAAGVAMLGLQANSALLLPLEAIFVLTGAAWRAAAAAALAPRTTPVAEPVRPRTPAPNPGGPEPAETRAPAHGSAAPVVASEWAGGGENFDDPAPRSDVTEPAATTPLEARRAFLSAPPVRGEGGSAFSNRASKPVWAKLVAGASAVRASLRRGWTTPVLFILGMLVVGSGVIGHYFGFSRYGERVDDIGWGATGIDWVDGFNRGRGGGGLLLMSGMTYAYTFEWPRPDDVAGVRQDVMTAFTALAILTAALLAAGALPWPARWRGDPDPRADPPPLPWPLVLLWVGCWVVLPAYGFYCKSIPRFLSPSDWLQAAANLLVANPWVARAIVAVLLGWAAGLVVRAVWFGRRDALASGSRRAGRVAMLLVVVGLVLLACRGTYGVFRGQFQSLVGESLRDQPSQTLVAAENRVWAGQWKSVWQSRYLATVWPAAAIATAALFMRLPGRPLRWAAVGLFVTVNLAQIACRLAWLEPEPRVDLVLRDVVDTQPADAHARTFMNVSPSGPTPGYGHPYGTVGRYYYAADAGRQLTPAEFRGGSLQQLARFGVNTDPNVVAADARRDPGLRRIIVWTGREYPVQAAPPAPASADDPYLPKLGNAWRRVAADDHVAWDHWNWQRLSVWRRREYVRAG